MPSYNPTIQTCYFSQPRGQVRKLHHGTHMSCVSEPATIVHIISQVENDHLDRTIKDGRVASDVQAVRLS